MRKIYKCCICGKLTSTLHEVFYGTAKRKLSIKYNFQVPLCNSCHAAVHGKNPKYIGPKLDNKIYSQQLFCKRLNVDFWDIHFILNRKITDFYHARLKAASLAAKKVLNDLVA